MVQGIPWDATLVRDVRTFTLPCVLSLSAKRSVSQKSAVFITSKEPSEDLAIFPICKHLKNRLGNRMTLFLEMMQQMKQEILFSVESQIQTTIRTNQMPQPQWQYWHNLELYNKTPSPLSSSCANLGASVAPMGTTKSCSEQFSTNLLSYVTFLNI